METKECLNCSATFSGNYCNNCGEKVYSNHDKSVAHIFEEVAHFLTHFEGKLFKSLKAMFTKPGLLTYDYCRGLRKKYFKPVSLYILLVVIYLILPFARGLNMPMQGYMGLSHRSFVENRILEKQQQKQISMEELSHLFEKKSEKVSKLMLIVILPLCGLVLVPLVGRRKEFYFFDHFILAAEINSAFLIFQFILFPILLFLISLIISKPEVLYGQNFEFVGLATSFLVVGSYTLAAFLRVYHMRPAEAIIKSVLFCLLQAYIVFIVYKFLLFTTVMALI